MIIAVNTGFKGDGHAADEFIYSCLVHLSEKNPAHQFIYFFTVSFDRISFFPKNVTAVISGPEPKAALLKQYHLNYKIPALLKKYKADALLNMNGICAGRTKVPQCLFIIDHVIKKQMASSLEKAKVIVTASSTTKQVIIDQYPISEVKIDIITPAIEEIFRPLTYQEKEVIKEKYAEGKEFFLAHSNNNLLNLLKAFSFFKKRQKSNMMLLISGKTGGQFKQEMKTFKFRNEVRLLENLSNEEQAKITAAAYAMVYPVLYDSLATIPLQAMTCKVPVLCSHTGALPEICGDAALYFDLADFKDIAEKMMLVFKDEDGAKELVKAGETLSQHYDWDKTSGLLWQSILKAIDN